MTRQNQKQLPKGWKWVRLGEVVTISPREQLKKYSLAKKVPMEALVPWQRKIAFYKVTEFRGGVKFRNGDTLLARITPSLENGKTAFVDILGEREIGFGSTEFIVLRAKRRLTIPKYIYYLARSPEFRDNAIKSMTGTSGRQRVQHEAVEEYSFPLPPLPEQKAIADVLSSLDDKIELLQEQNKTLEEMAQTLFRKWFIDNPERKKWEKVRLGEVVSIKYGKNLPIKELLPSGFPVFGGNGQIGFYSKYLYEEPQVLIACRGEKSGTVNISKPKSFITNNSLVLEIKDSDRLTFEFLKYYALSTDFTNYVSGSAQPQITIKDLSLVEIIIPPNTLINTFSKHVAMFEESLLKNETQIELLHELRDILLPKLVSGEVRVKI